MVVHVCNAITQDAVARILPQVPDQPGLHREFKPSLNCVQDRVSNQANKHQQQQK